MPQNLFFELSIVILLATVVSIIMRLIKQPLIIGYIITGVIAGPFFLDVVESSDTMLSLAKIGIALLLFIVGLNLNIKTLKEVGIVSLITGIGQFLFTSIIVYFIALYLGFNSLESIYIGIALSFSSTIIIIKLLSDKKDLDALYSRISVGFLIVQDFIALLVLIFISSSNSGATIGSMLGLTFFKGALIVALVFVVSNYVMPRTLHHMAKSQELLFLFSISWVLIVSLFLNRLGFGVEMGALIAGISLASSPYHYEISGKIRPLRDFFIILFFVVLGSEMSLSSLHAFSSEVLVLSFFVLIGKPIIVMALLGIIGYNKRVGFMSALTVAQISEFSLLIIIMGQQMGNLSHSIVSLITIVGLVTIAGSSCMVMYSNRIYPLVSKYLNIFERKKIKKDGAQQAKTPKIIMFGYNRIGYSIVKAFQKLKKKFIVVDYNPDAINLLKRKRIPCTYGDASDIEFIDELNLGKADLIISTIPDFETNLLVINKARSLNKKAIVVITSHHIEESLKLYEAGADYVILPHFLGGEHVSTLIEKFGTDISKFIKEKIRHVEELKLRKNFGHEHPKHL